MLTLTCLAGSIVALSCVPAQAGESEGAMVDETKRIISQYKAVFSEPPKQTPSDSAVDAPLLGNGDMGVCISGPPERQTFWLSKNDCWRLQSTYGGSMPQPIGHIEVQMPSLEGASYRIEQDLYEAVTVSTFSKGETTVTMRSWVAATEDAFFVELMSQGAPVPTEIVIMNHDGTAPELDYSGRMREFRPGLMDRRFVDDVDIPVEVACDIRLHHTKSCVFRLDPGAPVIIQVVARSSFDCTNPLQEAMDVRLPNPKQLWQNHTAWWRDYWSKSLVELGDPVIEQHYYLSNYVMASCSRNPEFPPGLFGTWITTDTPSWHGDYHLNYNHMAPYYGLYSSNHIEQADPYHAPILDFMERGKWYAREALDCRGVYYPVGIGPKGIETTRNSPHTDHNEKGGLFFGQKSNAAYCVVNLSMRWYHTYDTAYAKTIYPFVREVADFWEDYVEFEDGRYVIRGDSVHEGSGTDMNPVLSLGLVRNLFETALDMSEALGVDTERHEKWRHILEHMSSFPTQEKEGKAVFRYTEEGTPWWRDNTLGIQHIYPAGAIGHDSDPELLQVARNTIDVMARWFDFNGMNSFYPAAVRVGYDPNVILANLRMVIEKHMKPNGFVLDNPHGIENCSIVPNTVNEMLCMGHQGVLRVFPVWPMDRDAHFANIRAMGAFLVSSGLKNGRVQYVRLISEQGRACTIVNPWPGVSVELRRDGERAEVLTGARLTFETRKGEAIRLFPRDLENTPA